MARPYDLPSLTALVCFEAAARNLSFKMAAKELNVTPAAVSHQIKGLEGELASQLFRRQHRGVELTEGGAYLFVALQRGFEGISDTVRALRDRAESDGIVVRATTAVSALWLTPQISAFWKTHPGSVISQIVNDADSPNTNADISIHYGDMPDGAGEHRLLFHDRIIALGSPAFAARQGIATLADLVDAPLIYQTVEETDWTGWADWLATLGQGAPTGPRFAVNNYMIGLQLAQDDVGAVLGWERLTRPVLDTGHLVALVPDFIVSPQSFYLTVHPRAGAGARLFCDWIVATQHAASSESVHPAFG